MIFFLRNEQTLNKIQMFIFSHEFHFLLVNQSLYLILVRMFFFFFLKYSTNLLVNRSTNYKSFTKTYFLLIFKFKSNFPYKYFINNIINTLCDQFCFKSKLNNIDMNFSFESELNIKSLHKHFLIEFDENKIMM